MAPIQGPKKIDDIKSMIELMELMKTLGISDDGVETLQAGKERIKENLDEDKSSQWTAGKGFNAFANPKAQDEKTRSELNTLYTEAREVLLRFGDEIRSRDSHAEKMETLREQLLEKRYVVLVAGETSSGKSSMVNLILGKDILPTAHVGSTSVICELKYKERRAMTVHFIDNSKPAKNFTFEGMDLASIKEEIERIVVAKGDKRDHLEYKKVELFWPHPLLQAGVQIVDSPGFGESDILEDMVSQYLPKVLAFLYVINSANAGGVQKDRILKLLHNVKKALHLKQAGFSPKSALFVFNKWDLIPRGEIQEVKEITTELLLKTLPGLDPKTQMLHFSTARAGQAQEYGIASKEFAALLNNLNSLVTRSMESRLQLHKGWLIRLIDDSMISTAETFLQNADRKSSDVEATLRSVYEELESLMQDQGKDIKDLEKVFDSNTREVGRRLKNLVKSDPFRARFCSWKHEEGPPADMKSWKDTERAVQESFQNRLIDFIQEWAEKEHVLAEAHETVISACLSKYQQYETKIASLKKIFSTPPGDGSEIPGVIFLPLSLVRNLLLALKDGHTALFWVSAPLWAPLSLAAFVTTIPVALGSGVVMLGRRVKREYSELRKLKEYEQDRAPFLREAALQYLDALSDDFLLQFAKSLMGPVEECLMEVKEAIPLLIEDNIQMFEQLEKDKRSREDIKRIYTQLKEDCVGLKKELQRIVSE